MSDLEDIISRAIFNHLGDGIDCPLCGHKPWKVRSYCDSRITAMSRRIEDVINASVTWRGGIATCPTCDVDYLNDKVYVQVLTWMRKKRVIAAGASWDGLDIWVRFDDWSSVHINFSPKER